MVHPMTQLWRTTVCYALLLAGAAFLLQWLEYRYLVRRFSTEAYVVVIALLFAVVGAWVGNRLTARRSSLGFEVNQQAIEQLRLSDRELEVLRLLAEGQSNKEMAKRLNLSPNTIKTHLANLYGKLDAGRRTQAVSKARALSIIP
jgi:DNA-binding NarL/FixJ family response regulator